MSFVRKTYQLKFGRKRQTYIKVNGKTVLIEFSATGNHNAESKGTYTTTNPDIIAAMEKDSGYNVFFEIKEEKKVDAPEKETAQVRADPLEVKKQRELEEENVRRTEAEIAALNKVEEIVFDPAAVSVSSEVADEPVSDNTETAPETLDETVSSEVVNTPVVVSNVQEAKDYLKSKFPELTARQVSNKELVLAVAEEKGVDFVFEN